MSNGQQQGGYQGRGGQGGRRPGRGGGGQQLRVFIAKPQQGEMVRASEKSGAFDITIHVGLSNRPNQTVPILITVDSRPPQVFHIQDARDCALEGIRHDRLKPMMIKAEKAGFPQESVSLEISADTFKKATHTPAHPEQAEASSSRLEVKVGRLGPNRVTPVFVTTRDADGNPCVGTVLVCAGQKFQINGTQFTADQNPAITTDVNGKYTAQIKLLQTDGKVDFYYQEADIRISKNLLKEA